MSHHCTNLKTYTQEVAIRIFFFDLNSVGMIDFAQCSRYKMLMMCLIFTSITLQGDQNSAWKRHHKWFEKPFLWKFYETPSDRSRHGGFLHKKAVLGNLAKLTGKNLSQSLFFNKAAGQNVQTKCPTQDERRETGKSFIFFVSPLSFHLWNPSMYLISKWHLNL